MLDMMVSGSEILINSAAVIFFNHTLLSLLFNETIFIAEISALELCKRFTHIVFTLLKTFHSHLTEHTTVNEAVFAGMDISSIFRMDISLQPFSPPENSANTSQSH